MESNSEDKRASVQSVVMSDVGGWVGAHANPPSPSDKFYDGLIGERLDVYRLAIAYVAFSHRVAKQLTGIHRPARDQWLRAAQSIPLNIAEGNGKQSLKD